MSVTAITSHPRFKHDREIPISRAELEKKLPACRTTIFNLIKAGMPIEEFDASGHRFLLSDCRAWIAARGGITAACRVDPGYATTPEHGGLHA